MGKRSYLNAYHPKKTIEGFVGGLLFSVIASYLVSKYYIEIAEGKNLFGS
jgi:phosphatidate cytidylyltransferase